MNSSLATLAFLPRASQAATVQKPGRSESSPVRRNIAKKSHVDTDTKTHTAHRPHTYTWGWGQWANSKSRWPPNLEKS